jgi:hypothetical protein
MAHGSLKSHGAKPFLLQSEPTPAFLCEHWLGLREVRHKRARSLATKVWNSRTRLQHSQRESIGLKYRSSTCVEEPGSISLGCIYGDAHARGVGFESDAGVFRLTRQNMAALRLQIEIHNTDYLSGLTDLCVSPDERLITFIAPPWGDALRETSGLDLRRTTPPITKIVDFLFHRFSQNRLLCAVQVYEIAAPVSMAELRARFDWSTVRVYQMNAPGQNHGIFLGTRGWAP